MTHGVRRLVYTSTEDVVLGMQFELHGDETLPYPERPEDFRFETYASTKCDAERMVLAADKTPLSQGAEGLLETPHRLENLMLRFP